MKKSERLLYEPPRARDLSAFGVSGQTGPMGICIPGTALTSQFCANGDVPAGGECLPTGDSPHFGYCTLGDLAVEGCKTGSIHT
jgi:hypothetical protein